jgi:hypothetical protein
MKEIEIEIEKEKKKKSPLGWAVSGPNPLSLPRAHAFLPPPRGPSGPTPARPRSHPLGRCQPGPTPSVALAPSQPLSLWQAGPACQHLPRARDRANDAIAAGRHHPVVSPLTHLLARLAPCVPVPLRQPEPSRHPPARAVPSSPLCATIPVVASSPMLATSRPLPRPRRL